MLKQQLQLKTSAKTIACSNSGDQDARNSYFGLEERIRQEIEENPALEEVSKNRMTATGMILMKISIQTILLILKVYG